MTELPLLVNTTELRSGSYVFERYLLAEIAGQILPNSRCALCRKLVVPGKRGVAVIYSPEHERASYGNLITCGSIWLCAVCAAKISELRRVELVAAVDNHTGGLALLTFTIKHKKADALQGTLAVLDRAFENIFHGRWWVEFQASWNYFGKVVGLEVTYGLNGWHPHRHGLFFFQGAISDTMAAQMQSELTDRYLYLLGKAGGSALSGLAVNVKAAISNRAIVAAYLEKFDRLPESVYWGIESEITKSYVKKTKGASGQTFWELLRWAALGERDAVLLVREYAAAMRGKASLRYSRGLKFLLGVQDQSDQDLSDQIDKDGIELTVLVREIWRQVVAKKLRAQLLDVAGSGCVEDVFSFLGENNILVEG